MGTVLLFVAIAIFSFYTRTDYASYLLAQSAGPAANSVQPVIRASLSDSRGGFYDAVTAVRITRFLDDDPKHAQDAQFLLQSAQRHYSKALADGIWSAPLFAAEGDLLLRNGRACDAINPLEEAVSMDFYFSLSHFNLANAYAGCGSIEEAKSEAAIAILTSPGVVYASQWRRHPEFLSDALRRVMNMLQAWNCKSTSPDGERVQKLQRFVDKVNAAPTAGNARASIVLYEAVAQQLTSDPFAYIFQRRFPEFTTTRIDIDGLDSGTWTPEGMGQFKFLHSVTYTDVHRAYKKHRLDEFVRSLGTDPFLVKQ